MFNKSDSINELASALSVAQGNIEGAAKTAKNPHLRNKYADFQSVVEATRPALVEQGLSISQIPDHDGDGAMVLHTILMHKSGQYIMASMPVANHEQKGINQMQATGSALSYARRYSYESIVGVSRIEDDDGEKSGSKFKGKQSNPNKAEAPKEVDRPSSERNKVMEEVGDSVKKDLTRYYNWLKLMKDEKERIGERAYYHILVYTGHIKKSNEMEEQVKLKPQDSFKKMTEILAKCKKIKEHGDLEWYKENLASLWGVMGSSNLTKQYEETVSRWEKKKGEGLNNTTKEDRYNIISELEKILGEYETSRATDVDKIREMLG